MERLDKAVPVQLLYGADSTVEERTVNGHRVIRIGVDAPFDRICLVVFKEQNLLLLVYAHQSVTEEELEVFLNGAEFVPLEEKAYQTEYQAYLERYTGVLENADTPLVADSIPSDGSEGRQSNMILRPKGEPVGTTAYFMEFRTDDAGSI